MNIIPQPLLVAHAPGQFALTPDTLVTYSSAAAHSVALRLQSSLDCQLGIVLRLQQGQTPQAPSLHLRLTPAVEEIRGIPFCDEGYLLSVSAPGVLLAASTVQGLLYGVQSLLMLLPVAAQGAAMGIVQVPGVRVIDAPRFRWRGLMLDTGRHFFGVPFLLRVLDIMLLYKLNRLHWHVCEDQGWRLEVKQFPRLTEFGAWRRTSDGERYGGYYTQEQVRQVVDYAAACGIEVVPEIEMPGHSVAALASYPHLSCTGEVSEVSPHWGVHEDVYCAGREEVFGFLEGVLQEVFGLFPSTYIHVGGDEVPKTRWRQCPRCQQRISGEGLEGEDELQSWFLGRINTILQRHGRKLIGWDEMLEGGMCEGATVMSWRGMAGGVAAARAGHDVIMTPAHSCYLDYRQAASAAEPGAWYAVLTLEQAYAFDPVPSELPQPGSAGAAPLPRPASTEPMVLDGDVEEEGEGAGETEGESPGAAASGPGAAAADELMQERQGAGGGLEERAPATAAWAGSSGGLLPAVPPPPRPQEPGAGSGGTAAEGQLPVAECRAVGVPSAGQAALMLTPDAAKHILGGQGNLWTEYIATEEGAEYMLMPRLSATAEALWSPREGKNWASFQARLRAHEALWHRRGIRYRRLDS